MALACGAMAVHAQTAESLSAKPLVVAAASGVLKEVVVSGSRSEQSPAELPISLDLINAVDIERRQILDIRDVAAELPDVNVARAGPFDDWHYNGS